MKPVLFTLAGVDVTGYGVSKALAIVVAGWLLGRELRRVGRDAELAWPLTIAGAAVGFLGAKLYYLAEHAGSLTAMDFGGSGFTWYGGLLGGALAVIAVVRAKRLPLGLIAGLVSAPLSFAYGMGRLGCLLAGDGTYGTRSDLPWAMSFPHGTVPTTQRVHPTPLYEAIAAFMIGALLWRLRDRVKPPMLFGIYATLSGLARFLVEFVRVNDRVLAGLSQPQLWSLGLIAVGLFVTWRSARPTVAGRRRQMARA